MLSIDTFNTHIGFLNSTFGTVFGTNNNQDANITNINNTITSFLQTSEFDNYKTTLNSTLTSIINTNTSQDTETNNLKITIPSYLQSASATLIYAPIANPTFTGLVNGITKSMVGLSNVDNTSDANKPVSTATHCIELESQHSQSYFYGDIDCTYD